MYIPFPPTYQQSCLHETSVKLFNNSCEVMPFTLYFILQTHNTWKKCLFLFSLIHLMTKQEQIWTIILRSWKYEMMSRMTVKHSKVVHVYKGGRDEKVQKKSKLEHSLQLEVLICICKFTLLFSSQFYRLSCMQVHLVAI